MTLLLFFQVMSLEARKAMSYRATFWINAVVGVTVGFGIPYFLWSSIYTSQNVERIGEFSLNTMILYYVVVVLLGKVIRGGDMGLGVSREIYEGTLTRYLVYPTDVLLFKYAQHVGSILPYVLQAALFSVVFAFALDLPEVEFHVYHVAGCVISIFVANVVHYFMSLPILGVAFWADNVWSLTVMLRFVSSFLGGAMIPVSLFPEALQQVLAYLPFMYYFFLPTQTLLGAVTFVEWIQGLGICLAWGLAFYGITRWVWHRGQLQYTGVGI